VPAPKPQLRALPSVEALLQHPSLANGGRELPRSLLVEAARAELADVRAHIKKEGGSPPSADDLAARIARRVEAAQQPDLRRVLNATGIVLHTNLGRAPLAEAARDAVARAASGYSNLEWDAETGTRGSRHAKCAM